MSRPPKNSETQTRIYVLKDPDTLEIRYVGKTVKSLKQRLSDHINKTTVEINNHRINWIKSILAKNNKPIIEEIELCTWENSAAREIYWIKYYKDRGYRLVNGTIGGEGALGAIRSKDTIEKQKKAQRKNLEKVYQYDISGIFLKEWDNIPTAAEELGITSGGIRRCALGERGKYKDFIWSFSKEPTMPEYNRVYDSQGSKLGIRQSEIAKLFKLETQINNSCNICIFDGKSCIYEGISLDDVALYLQENNYTTAKMLSIKERIYKCLDSDESYLKLSFRKTPSIKKKYYFHLKAINVESDKIIFECDGLDPFCEQLSISRENVLNNIKGKTKSININNTKSKILWEKI